MEKINLAEKFSLFTEQWSPKLIGRVNDFDVKLARLVQAGGSEAVV